MFTRIAFITCLLILTVVVGSLLWHASESIPEPGRVVSEGRAQIGGPFHLTDQNGKPVSNSDFDGQYQLIYFGYTYCPDVCPTTLGVIAEAISLLGTDAGRVTPIFITVDPARDTPQVLKSYIAAFGPSFVGLTGNQKQISAIEKEFHVYAQKRPLSRGAYAMDHSNVIYLLDPEGHLAAYYPRPMSPQDLAKDMRAKIQLLLTLPLSQVVSCLPIGKLVH